MNKNNVYGCLFIAIYGLGCNMDDIVKKADLIEDILKAHCNCEEVRISNYSVSDITHTTVDCEMIGCPYTSKEAALKDIDSLLRSKIPDYCGIDEFTIDFINKGKHQVVSLDVCKESQ